MPGSANPMLSRGDTFEAKQLVKDMMSFKHKAESGVEISRLLAQYMERTGAEVYHHKFHAQSNQFHPLKFFSASSNIFELQDNSSSLTHGSNVVGIIRAPRSDGKEAIVLVTPYNSSKVKLSEAMSLGLAYSIFSLLSGVNWLAKDIVWLAADSRYGEHSSVAAWLRDYHTPVFVGLKEKNSESCHKTNDYRDSEEYPTAERKTSYAFRRAGTMAAALVFKVVDKQQATRKNTLHIYSEASNGQMPNLDLINIVHYLAVHRQRMHVKVDKFYFLLSSAWLKIVGQILELIGKVAQTINPQWKFGISAADYIEGTATLASSLYHQALGIPTGLHGAFRDYQVDAITLEISPKVSLDDEDRHADFLFWSGCLLEGIIRSVNNLLEKFHQSFFLYLLTSPSKFVSVGVYMIAFALLVAPLPIVAAALYLGSQRLVSSSTTDGDKAGVTPSVVYGEKLKSWIWLHSAKVVFIVHLWGVIVALGPYLIIQLPERTATGSTLAWLLFSFLSLVTLYGIMGSPYFQSQSREWAILKAVMLAVVSIGLGIMSIINFATAQIGAMLIVPFCLLTEPIKHMATRSMLRRLIMMALNAVFAFVSFPPSVVLLGKMYAEGSGGVSVGDFWMWAESLWVSNSATYLYMLLIHLPCWVLCILVLLHPC